ncbi:hypothetical protein [Rubinisphaera italica]|uniref:Uncharacterized protein n=1 Tax=Rubinisphaera italica TaxID=2527969 RepID=A0A5C5XD69_9PLAN|nr:hypothetical protein [Rubinisphaera italica]TWT60748.1 hypothetical protein Pan54_14750 [Rubinisphaera italica]
MNLSRRTAVMAIGSAMACLSLDSSCDADDETKAASDAFAGIWSSHYQQTFIYLIIQPHQKAVFALLDQGYSFGEVPWVPANNGIIVRGFPMLRLWKTKQPDWCKVRMQAVPPEATNDTFVKFPLNFYMTRQKQNPLPPALAQLKIPKDWLGADPPSDFDDMVGKPREVNPN